MPPRRTGTCAGRRTAPGRGGKVSSGSRWPPVAAVRWRQGVHSWNDVVLRAQRGNPAPERRVEKSGAEWRALLSEDQYRVTRQAGTERPFSSQMCSLFTPGRYRCVCCGTVLFDATDKFESHSGWPSFTAPLGDNVVNYHGDGSHGMQRMEATCSTCDAPPGPCLPRRPAAHRPAVLHQRGVARQGQRGLIGPERHRWA